MRCLGVASTSALLVLLASCGGSSVPTSSDAEGKIAGSLQDPEAVLQEVAKLAAREEGTVVDADAGQISIVKVDEAVEAFAAVGFEPQIRALLETRDDALWLVILPGSFIDGRTGNVTEGTLIEAIVVESGLVAARHIEFAGD